VLVSVRSFHKAAFGCNYVSIFELPTTKHYY